MKHFRRKIADLLTVPGASSEDGMSHGARLAAFAVALALLSLWCHHYGLPAGVFAAGSVAAGFLGLVCLCLGKQRWWVTSENGPEPETQLAEMDEATSPVHDLSGDNAALKAQVELLAAQLREMTGKAAALEQKNAALQRVEEHRHVQYLSSIMSLVRAVEAKDPYTAGHSDRVSRYSVALAQRLNEMQCAEPANVKLVRYAAHLHDIGKIHVHESVLNKPGELTDKEYSEVKMHAAYTQYILSCLQLPEDLAGLALVASFHHERYEGQGYPSGLPAEFIPIESRIIAVADTYDALTSNRPHRQGMPQARALAVMTEVAGTQLDPLVVDVFMRLYREGVITKLQYGGESMAGPGALTIAAEPPTVTSFAE